MNSLTNFPLATDLSIVSRLQNELITRLCYYDRETKIAEVDYLVNSLVMTIGIQKEEVQKKLAAMTTYKQRFVESLYLDSHNPRHVKAKEKEKIDERSIVDKVASFGGPQSKKP